MSDHLGSTQPNMKVQKAGRGRAFLFNALGLIVILVLAILGGYRSGISIRQQNQSSIIMGQIAEQYQNALIDMQFGRYEIAKQRLEWILQNDPSFPGVQEELTKVLVLMNVPTPTPTPSLTPTPDFTGAEQAYARAQQLIAAQDWPGAIGALDEMRKLDPNYQTSLVDGMYYFALRNYGYNLINQGNLEGGIYQITLAERFGPLDRDTNGLREGARVYLIGASFWELDWAQAISYFVQARNWGNLWDGTMTSSERYRVASMRYGDELVAQENYCGDGGALTQYQNAQTIGALDKTAQDNYDEIVVICFPATSTPDLGTPTETPTPGGPPTDTPLPSETPTETPTPTP